MISTIKTYFSNFITKYLFHPKSETVSKETVHDIIRIDNHLALYQKSLVHRQDDRVLLVAHGMSGSIYNSNHKIDFLKNVYRHDVYFIEYPGFSDLPGTANESSCSEEVYFWFNYLKERYTKVDLYGISMGGGVITHAVQKYQIVPHNIYLHGTFTSIRDVLQSYRPNVYRCLYFLFLCCNFFDTNTLLKSTIKCNKLVILHSEEDDVIPYDHAMQNYNDALLNHYISKVRFIDLKGNHRNCYRLKEDL